MERPCQKRPRSYHSRHVFNIMSDYVSNASQSAEIASANHTNSSRASPESVDSANDNEATLLNNAWPLLKVTDHILSDWPNSNDKPVDAQSTASEGLQPDTAKATPERMIPTSRTHRDPLGSQALMHIVFVKQFCQIRVFSNEFTS